MVERALAHTIRDKAEAAYARSDLLEGVFRALVGEIVQELGAAREVFDLQRVAVIAVELELRERVQPRGRAGVAGDQDELILLRAGGVPRQVVLRPNGLVVLVDAEDREIDVPSRVREVVRVSPEERDAELGRYNEAHVRVLLVLVEVVLAPGVEGDRVAAQSRLLVALLLELRLLGLLSLQDLCARHSRLDTRVDLRRHVLDPFEDIQLQIRALDLFGRGLREVAVPDVVVLGARDLLESARPDVVVGQDEPGLGNERPGAPAVEPHRREPHVVEPRLVGRPAVVFCRYADGTLLKGHIPSSARTGRTSPAVRTRHRNPALLFIVSPVLSNSAARPFGRSANQQKRVTGKDPARLIHLHPSPSYPFVTKGGERSFRRAAGAGVWAADPPHVASLGRSERPTTLGTPRPPLSSSSRPTSPRVESSHVPSRVRRRRSSSGYDNRIIAFVSTNSVRNVT